MRVLASRARTDVGHSPGPAGITLVSTGRASLHPWDDETTAKVATSRHPPCPRQFYYGDRHDAPDEEQKDRDRQVGVPLEILEALGDPRRSPAKDRAQEQKNRDGGGQEGDDLENHSVPSILPRSVTGRVRVLGPRAGAHHLSTGSKISVTIVLSPMPAPAALGCCAPDFGRPYIASIVRRMLTCVMPLPSGYASGLRPGLICAPAKMVAIRFWISSRSWL